MPLSHLMMLEGILRYVARDNPAAALRYVDGLLAQCEAIQQSPGMGEAQEEQAPQLRRFTFRSYAIYFQNLDDQVRIERVLHAARQIQPDHFG